MKSMLSELSEKILDTLSQSGKRYLLVAYPKEDVCYWSENSITCFDLSGKTTTFGFIWEDILYQEDRMPFFSDYEAMLNGQCERILGEYRFRRRDGSYRHYFCNIWCVRPESEEMPLYLTGIITDPDGEKTIDPVTLLPSNYDFYRTLRNLIPAIESCIVMVLGIDNFKFFNEMYSYAFGNQVLCQCADILKGLLPKHASLFRSDGDGFHILLIDMTLDEAENWFSTVQRSLCEPKEINGISICYTVSAGVCLSCTQDDADELYRNANFALQAAKSDGKNMLVCYNEAIRTRAGYRTKLLECLRQSIAMGFSGFSMYYQPLVHAQNGGIAGCEALLRWEHPDFEGIAIQSCIDCLEENGLIGEVGKWILDSSVRQCAKWVRYIPDFCMNINISCQQFENPDFKFTVLNILNEYHVNPENIVLELTESGRVRNSAKVGESFDFLRSQRLRISFDDFGTGYASLDIFRKLSADELKIDRSFLERITYDVTDQALITTLISLCHSMNMLVCVEGIETEELEAIIRQMNPDYLQGFYYSRPLTAAEFENRYFPASAAAPSAARETVPFERQNSMAYSPFRPAHPLTMEDIVNHAYAGIFQVGMDREFTFLTCNEGYRRMLGYTTADIEKKFKNHALGFVHPDDIDYVNEEIRRQLGEGDTVTIEFRVVRKDNTPIWILGTGNVYHSPDGSSSLIVVIIDHNAAKLIQKKQLAELGIYQRMLQYLPTGIKLVRFDPDFTIDYISSGFLNIIGYTLEEIQTVFDGKYINLIYEEDRESVFNDILEQLKKSDIVTMHYRTPCKDGSLIWVETVSRLCPPDEDGIQRACSSVVDITHLSVSEPPAVSKALNIANRYEMAATQWGDLLFEFNFKTSTFCFSENFVKQFCVDTVISIQAFLEMVDQRDRPEITRILKELESGVTPAVVELRLVLPDGVDHWFSLAFSKPEHFGGIPVSVLGKISDIDKEKQEREMLVMQAQHDQLTGLLNKSSTEQMIRKLLLTGPDSRFAMFMIDVDGFKQINDKLGHFSGDAVLRRLSAVLSSLFRNDDIVGRVGGDEFMIFVPCMDEQAIIKKAGLILETLRDKAFMLEDTDELTVSIGISFCPENGCEFYDLFRCADSALYRAKELGRNRFCLSSR